MPALFYVALVLFLCIIYAASYIIWMRRQWVDYRYKKETVELELEPFGDEELNFEEEEIQRGKLIVIDV